LGKYENSYEFIPLRAGNRKLESFGRVLAWVALGIVALLFGLDHAAPADLTADAVERDLVFVRLTGMFDPPRPEAKAAVDRCHAAGIRVVMIAGDLPHTATAIARGLGFAAKDDVPLRGSNWTRRTTPNSADGRP